MNQSFYVSEESILLLFLSQPRQTTSGKLQFTVLTILLFAFQIMIFPLQRPFLNILYDADEIPAVLRQRIFTFHREGSGIDVFPDEPLLFEFPKSR